MKDLVNRLRGFKHRDAQEAANIIEALRSQLATVLARETATTARLDARIEQLEAEIVRLNSENVYDIGYAAGWDDAADQAAADEARP